VELLELVSGMCSVVCCVCVGDLSLLILGLGQEVGGEYSLDPPHTANPRLDYCRHAEAGPSW
jgi:hypothetical protein